MRIPRRVAVAGFASTLTNQWVSLPAFAAIPSSDIYFYEEVNTETCLKLKISLLEEEARCTEENIDHMNLHIQSDGGSLSAAMAVCDAMERSTIPIHTYVEGTVASAASLLSICGAKRYMTKSSTLLLHQPSITLGSMKHDEFQDESYNMKVMYDLMMNIYVRHSTKSRQVLNAIIDTEKVLTAEEAQKMGFVDTII